MVYTHSLKQGIVFSKGQSSLQYVHLIRQSSTSSSSKTTAGSIKASTKDSFHASLAQGAVQKSVLTVPRPPTAFAIFQKENIAKVKQEHPKAKDSELTKLLSQRWNVATEKEEYSKKAQNLQKDYEQKLAATLNLRKKLQPLLHKPANALNLFVKEKGSLMKGLSNKERMAKIAAQWKNLTPEEKQKFVANASKLQKEMADRKAKLSAAEVVGLREMAIETRMNRLKRLGRTSRRTEIQNLATKFGRPKRPEVAIVAFAKQQRAALPQGKKLDLKSVLAKWNSMSASEKQKWQDHTKSALAQYKKNMAAWEQKMIADGHKDIVTKFHVKKWNSFLPEGVKMPKTIKQHFREAKQNTKRMEQNTKRRASLLKKRELKAKRASALRAKRQLKRAQKQQKLEKQRKIAAARRERLQKKKAAALEKKKALVEKNKAMKAKKVALKLKKALAAKNARAIRKLRLQKRKAAALKAKKIMAEKKKKAALKKKAIPKVKKAAIKKTTKKVLAKKTAIKAKKATPISKKAKLAAIRGSKKRVIMKKAMKVAKKMQKVKAAASKKPVPKKAAVKGVISKAVVQKKK